MERTHFGQHGPLCFGCKVQTITMAPSGTGSVVAATHKDNEHVLQKDMAAFAEMKKQGLHPLSLKGSHAAAQAATEKFEVESIGVVPNKKTKKRYKDAFAEFGRVGSHTPPPRPNPKAD